MKNENEKENENSDVMNVKVRKNEEKWDCCHC